MVSKGEWFDKSPPGCGGLAPETKICPKHLDYQSQSAPLTPADLLQTYLLLLSASLTYGRPYFSFFNCGVKSGASQPHKHVQFLPILQGFGGPPIERVARCIKLDNECASVIPIIPRVPLFRSSFSRLTWIPSSSETVHPPLCSVHSPCSKTEPPSNWPRSIDARRSRAPAWRAHISVHVPARRHVPQFPTESTAGRSRAP
jgi:hypothetical protein